jgi:zinc protease
MKNLPSPLLLVLTVGASLTAAPAGAQEIPFTTFELDNGLQVVFHEDPTLPLVTVNIAYRFGSLDEPEGQTGYAHLAEHLMFMGTERVPGGSFDETMEAGGGWNNAYTGDDQTVYYDVGPASQLPTLLWLEADRIERIGPAMDQHKLDLQRDVVRNERRQNYEVEPYGVAWLVMPEVTYPEGHPYAHTGIGSHADLIAATVEDFQEIYARGYAPANASMVVAGDFDPVATRALIESLFADIPGGEPLQRPEPRTVTQAGARRIVIEDQIEIPRLVMQWHSPPWLAPLDAELDLVGSILGEDKVGRLNKAVVIDEQLAQWVSVGQSSGLLGSTFTIMADAMQGVSIDDLERAIDAELQRFARSGPTEAELLRARNQWEASFVGSLESLDDRADTLNRYWLHTGNHGYLTQDMARYSVATVPEVQAAFDAVVVPERVVMWIVPEGEAAAWIEAGVAEAAPAAEEVPAEEVPTEETVAEEPTDDTAVADGEVAVGEELTGDGEAMAEDAPSSPRDTRPDDLPWRDFVAPVPEVFTLSNGLEVWYTPRDTIPALVTALVIPGGAACDPAGQAGLAEFTADLMDEGAGKLDATELADVLATNGAWISTWAGSESLVVGAWTLSRNAEQVLPRVVDVVAKPRLARPDFQRVQAQTLSYLTQRSQDPGSVASVAGWRRFYGDDHPYSWPSAGYADSVSTITLRDVRAWHKRHVTPTGAHLVVVGDPGDQPIEQLLEHTFGRWKARPAPPEPAFPTPAHAERDTLAIYLVDRPGSPQTVIRAQLRGLTAGDQRRLETDLVNKVLGGSFTSRLMQNLREDKGWTYGAGSAPLYFRHDGSIVVRTSLEAAHTGEALVEIFAELDRIVESGLTGDELGKAVRSLQNDHVETHGSITSVAWQLANLVDSDLPPEAAAAWLRRSSELTVEDLSSHANGLYPMDGAIVILVGDGDTIRAQLEAHGFPAPMLVDAEGALVPSN